MYNVNHCVLIPNSWILNECTRDKWEIYIYIYCLNKIYLELQIKYLNRRYISIKYTKVLEKNYKNFDLGCTVYVHILYSSVYIISFYIL